MFVAGGFLYLNMVKTPILENREMWSVAGDDLVKIGTYSTSSYGWPMMLYLRCDDFPLGTETYVSHESGFLLKGVVVNGLLFGVLLFFVFFAGSFFRTKPEGV